jgi:hypothetical protein
LLRIALATSASIAMAPMRRTWLRNVCSRTVADPSEVGGCGGCHHRSMGAKELQVKSASAVLDTTWTVACGRHNRE